jgi:hypothetical protein
MDRELLYRKGDIRERRAEAGVRRRLEEAPGLTRRDES